MNKYKKEIHKRAIIFFIEDEDTNEYTQFKTESGSYDLCDFMKIFKHQYIHFNRLAQGTRELEALNYLIKGGNLEDFRVQSRFNILKKSNERG